LESVSSRSGRIVVTAWSLALAVASSCPWGFRLQIGKGDIHSQRQRRRNRYRGCRVCGLRNQHCVECGDGRRIVAAQGCANLCLVVDGSFVPVMHHRGQHLPGHGGPRFGVLGYGGAGLVLVLVYGPVRSGEILASRACGFDAIDSADAEFQAVVRGARWAPGVAIYTDARDLPAKMLRTNPRLDVHYLDPNARADAYAYALAHRLSVEGRCRQAPESAGPSGPEAAIAKAGRTKAERRQLGVDLLLAEAAIDPAFDGNFEALAERMGWNSGKRWRENPAIKKAAARWIKNKELP
jgi:hypothetical protein